MQSQRLEGVVDDEFQNLRAIFLSPLHGIESDRQGRVAVLVTSRSPQGHTADELLSLSSHYDRKEERFCGLTVYSIQKKRRITLVTTHPSSDRLFVLSGPRNDVAVPDKLLHFRVICETHHVW